MSAAWDPEIGPPDLPLNENLPESWELIDLAAKHRSPSTAISANGDQPHVDPTSFAARVTATRVDLAARIRDGIPPIDYLPASEGMLIRGKRHQIAAPKKEGKSITMLVHWVTMVQAGASVLILDRENGANLYASRLEQIVDALELDADALTDKLIYHEFPRLRDTDGNDLAAMCAQADIVVFDSQRMFLTDLDLDEDSSNDYATFVGIAIDPLFRAGIATCILDNTGHVETKRTRGSSAKGDLNEIIYTLEATEPFGLTTIGKVKLEITDSRFGTAGTWEMTIGAGTFQPWQRGSTEAVETASDEWKPDALMERVSVYLQKQSEPVSRTNIADHVIGKRKYLFIAIDHLLAGKFAEETDAKHIKHLRQFPSSQAVPQQFPELVGEDQFPGSPLSRGNRNGELSERDNMRPVVPVPSTVDDDIPF